MPAIFRPDLACERRIRSHRRRERGAALVEAAFMMPMFIILFFTSLYAHNVNSKQITLNTTARAQAWAYAMSNCNKGPGSPEGESLPLGSSGNAQTMDLEGGSPGGGTSAASSALSSGSVTGAISSFLSAITSVLSDIFANPPGSQSTVRDSVSWRLPNVYDGSGYGVRSTPLYQSVTVVCNEQAQNGSIVTAVEDLLCSIVHASFC